MPDTPNTESNNLDKLDGQSMDITAQRLAAIKAMLPEAFDLDGNLVRDKLLEALKPASYKASDDIPSFGLAWPGKQSAFAAAGVPTTATLRPCPEESVDFDTTQNLLIEGDNLEVLKTLQRSYHGKVKMIYIDPPYNTGKDFVYPDNYGEGLDTYLQRTEQKDDDGFWKSTNSETSGRKHANWLSMMTPRLTLARNLLRDDGVIFISIDDNESVHLQMLCDEIFGAENFLANIVWQKRTSPDSRIDLGPAHDYILCYASNKQSSSLNKLPLTDKQKDSYKNPDEDPRGPWTSTDFTAQGWRPNQMYKIATPGGTEYNPPPGRCWGNVEENYNKLKAENRLWFGADGNARPRVKNYLSETDGTRTWTWWPNREAGHNQEAKKEVIEILPESASDPFSTPKPVRLLARILQVATSKDDIVIDFFAGSGTTGHAVMAQNAEDGGNRRYICVQLPEPLDEPVTLDDGVVCETIFDLTRERLKRAGKKIKEEAGLNAEKLDTRVRVFKLDSSNFTAWNGDPTTSEADLLERLEQLNDQTVAGRSETDILWEMLLKMGLPLDLQLEHFELAGASFIGIADRTKVISTQKSIPTTALEAILDLDIPPSELVVLDSAFADDSARANIATLYKERKDEDGQPVCKLKVV